MMKNLLTKLPFVASTTRAAVEGLQGWLKNLAGPLRQPAPRPPRTQRDDAEAMNLLGLLCLNGRGIPARPRPSVSFDLSQSKNRYQFDYNRNRRRLDCHRNSESRYPSQKRVWPTADCSSNRGQCRHRNGQSSRETRCRR
jgi:hypothetical protein